MRCTSYFQKRIVYHISREKNRRYSSGMVSRPRFRLTGRLFGWAKFLKFLYMSCKCAVNFVMIIGYVKRKLQEASAGCIGPNGAGTASRAAFRPGVEILYSCP